MDRVLTYLVMASVVLGQEHWSPEEGNSTFEPSSTVLEQWTSLSERNEKVMKKPDRYIVSKPPKEQYQQQGNNDVSETDLFLLGAIEKLAYKVENLEKRLSRTEEMLYQLISGSQFHDKQEPCPQHFKRYSGICYHVSIKQINWKSASSMCRSLGSALVEFETKNDKRDLINSLKSDVTHSGKDFWTGGLNPGLLWIWSNSAKPILTNSTEIDSSKISGDGRCLLLKYDMSTKSYVYRGADCSTRNHYICRYMENSIGRELRRLQRKLHFHNETATN